MITEVKRLILRSIERAGYVVLKRDDRRFDESQLRYDFNRSAGIGTDSRTTAQLQAVMRELMSAREATARAERELEKARAKLWELGGVRSPASCGSGHDPKGLASRAGEASNDAEERHND
jgi:hypothetical protein